MSLAREQQTFPTRNYPYSRCTRAAALPPEIAPPAVVNILMRRIVGLDDGPRPVAPDELSGLNDPFGKILRSGADFPLSLRAVVARIDTLDGGPDALPDQLVFFVADGGHDPWTPETDALARAFRFVVARGSGEFTLLISSSTLADSIDDRAFVQIIGWDAIGELFHYYERLAGTWFWAGSSPHALAPETRGHGPFDSHVNGSLVMKELRSPWLHWHAPLAGINADAFAPDDALRNDPLFLGRVTAERLETEIVRPGIQRWNAARVRKSRGAGGVWQDVPSFLRQLITTTTVNLTTSETPSSLAGAGQTVRPPISFFLNRDILFDTLDLVPDDASVSEILIPGEQYQACLARYDVHRSDGAIRLDGDVHFAFLTPEAAFEDTNLIDALVQAGQLSLKLVACVAMVDFCNPVFSDARASLLKYVPDQVPGPDLAISFEQLFASAVSEAVTNDVGEAGAVGSGERAFLANWQEANWAETFRARIAAYLSLCGSLAADAGVVDEWFRLIEYRRRLFRRRPLAEFALTTPITNIPIDALGLRMTEAARCEEIAQA